MVDLYAYRSELKRSLLRSWQRLDLETQPLDWAWILYAIRVGQTTDSQLLVESVDRSLRWIETDTTWSSEGNLGAIGLICRLLRQEGHPEWESIAMRLTQTALQLTHKVLSKFSRLNDPCIVYSIVAGGEPRFSDDLREWFQRHCLRNSQSGNWRRRMLFSAAFVELGDRIIQFAPEIADLTLDELPCALWFAETCSDCIMEDSRRDLWSLLADVKEQILLEPVGDDIAEDEPYQASPIDVAMLYLAAVSQTREVDPITLFHSIPLHPKIRQASESLFLKGEYVNAVLEAAKSLIDEIKHRAGHPTNPKGKPLDGNALVQQVFGSQNPILKFNALATQSDRDEHRGLKLITEGIVAAIRNPKGHDPKDKITLAPYEALDQLVIVSYIYKRVDSAHRQ